MKIRKWLPAMIVAAFAAWLVGGLQMPKSKGFDFDQFGRVPLVANGRIQPFDSLARNTLLQLRGKQMANLDPWNGMAAIQMPATEWLLTVMTKPELADSWPEFRIDNPDVKGLLGLPGEPDPAKQLDGKHFTWLQIEPKLPDLAREAERASQVDDSSKTPYDQALLKLWNAQTIYNHLKASLGPAAGGQLLSDFEAYGKKARAGYEALNLRDAKQPFDEATLNWLAVQLQAPLVVPPDTGTAPPNQWQHAIEAVVEAGPLAAEPNFSLVAYNDIAGAFRANNEPGFNTAVAGYLYKLDQRQFAPALKKARSEQYYNFIQPFYKAMVIYLSAFLLVLAYWFRPGAWDWLRRSAVGLVVLALLMHTTGLLFRMWLEGRPPVTNLYSSAIFIGWGSTVLGLILERFWRNSIGSMVSCIIGFLTLIIAHHLALGSEDTMEMMRAVLDTNFWLATHVVVVTLGYASTYVAGILAILYVIMGMFTPFLTSPMSRGSAQAVGAGVALIGVKTGGSRARTALQVAESAEKGELGKSLNRMIYGIICFATLFSFVGTVLGGIWADQSWGRFWGWDPKENGALIIVLWNALVLHARWGGLVRERGLALLAIGGNIVTSWSWFGVNMLGIGLHSYGFTSAAFWWLLFFGGTQALLILLGSLPLNLWRSFHKAVPPPVPRAVPAGT